MKEKNVETVDDYLAPLPDDVRKSLERIRSLVKKLVPEATEKISWGMPMFYYNGMFIGYAAFTKHCSLFPCSAATLKKFKKEISSYKTSKGTIQFTADRQIPISLLKKIIFARMAEAEVKKLKKEGKKNLAKQTARKII